jgi:mRNA interferase RelE/StbE
MPHKWAIIFTPKAEKTFAKLDHMTQREIERYLSHRVLSLEDPRALGETLKGGLSGYWSYRCSDYRIICKIEDHDLVVLAVHVDHRREVHTRH